MSERKERRLSGLNRPGFNKIPPSSSQGSVPRISTFETVDELDDYDPPSSRKASGSRGPRTNFLQLPNSGGNSGGSSGGIVNSAFSTVDDLDELDQRYRKPSQVSGTRRKISQQVQPVTVLPANDSLGTVDELDDLDQKYLRKPSTVRPGRFHVSASPAPTEIASEKKQKDSYFKKPVGRTNLVLLILAIVFFLTTEVMVSVYLLEIYKEPPPIPCLSEVCLTKGKLLLTTINPKTDPCIDFYDYACGNFQRDNFHGHQHRDLQDLMDNTLYLRMDHILKELHVNGSSKEDFERKAGQFHQLCMDSDVEVVATEVVQVLQDIEWPVLTNVISDSFSIEHTLKEAHQHGIPAIFRASRLSDQTNPSTPLWVLREGQLPIPRQHYKNPKMMKAYLTFIKEMVHEARNVEAAGLSRFRQFDVVSEESLKEAIVDFETKLNTVIHEPDYFKLTIAEFYRTYPSLAKLYQVPYYLDDMAAELGETSLGLTQSSVLIMKDRDYFRVLNEALGNATKSQQKIYIGWRIFYSYLELLQDDPHFRNSIYAFWDLIGKPTQSRPQRCARLVTEALPDGGVALYGKRYFQKGTATKVNLLFDKLTQSAIELVDKQDWIDEVDRNIAKARFANLTRQLPFSDELMTKNLTNQLYAQGNIQYDSFFLTMRNFQKVRQSFVTSGMFSTPIKFNNLLAFKFGADYRLLSPYQGVIGVFPKTFLPPFSDPEYPAFSQYSQLGFTYARELAHVVDYQWFNLNTSSTEANAPTPATLERYHMRLGSMLEFYRNISILLDLPLDNETLYEDSADQAALRLAYRAYQKVIKDAHDSVLPGIAYEEFSFEQMFFLTLAQKFCENEDSTHIKDRAHTGFSHPRVRLTAMVMNSDEFNTAFQCGKEDNPGSQLFDIPDPPRKLRYRQNITAKQIDEWYHWFERKPGLPTWSKAW